MKLPCRILGLIAAVGAAPVIVGCAGEPSEPIPNTTDQNIETRSAAQGDDGEPAADEIAEGPASSSAEVAASEPSSEPRPERTPSFEEEEVPSLEEDAPREVAPSFGFGRSPVMLPHEPGPTAPYGGSGGPGQDPCPACGMG